MLGLFLQEYTYVLLRCWWAQTQSYLFNCFVTYFKWKHGLFVWNKEIYQIFRNKDHGPNTCYVALRGYVWLYSSQTRSVTPPPPFITSFGFPHDRRCIDKVWKKSVERIFFREMTLMTRHLTAWFAIGSRRTFLREFAFTVEFQYKKRILIRCTRDEWLALVRCVRCKWERIQGGRVRQDCRDDKPRSLVIDVTLLVRS